MLGLLVAGGAVLGVAEAPAGADLAVHDGATQTLGASRVDGSYTTSQYQGLVLSFDFQAPDHALEVARGPGGQVEGRRQLAGAAASGLLGPVRRLLGIGNFSSQGAYFASTLPASVLVAPATRARVSGTYRTLVEVKTGYVVAVLLKIDAVEGSQHLAESLDYHLTRVGGWTR